MGQTVAETFGGKIAHGKSFLSEISKHRATTAS
jgi:hypothetical protein